MRIQGRDRWHGGDNVNTALRRLQGLFSIARILRAPTGSGAPKQPSRSGGRKVGAGVVTFVALAVVTVGLLASSDSASAANFTVNTTIDGADGNPGDGHCEAGLTGSEGQCSLRAAIMEANAHSGHDTIHVPPGLYELEIPTLNEDLPDTGDFDITASVTIEGFDRATTIIDGGFPPEGSPIEQLGHGPPYRDPPVRPERDPHRPDPP